MRAKPASTALYQGTASAVPKDAGEARLHSAEGRCARGAIPPKRQKRSEINHVMSLAPHRVIQLQQQLGTIPRQQRYPRNLPLLQVPLRIQRVRYLLRV